MPFKQEKLDRFIKKANVAHQQLCVWFYLNNKFVSCRDTWYEIVPFGDLQRRGNFRYEKFWDIIIPTLQHSWVLSTARLLDPAFSKHGEPRICLDYILSLLSNKDLESEIRNELKDHCIFTHCIRELRHNVYAHNDENFKATRIEAGAEKFFEWLEIKIDQIKSTENCLQLGKINTETNEIISKKGVQDIFEDIIRGRY